MMHGQPGIKQFSCLLLKKLIISRKGGGSKEEVKSKGKEIESANSPNTSDLQGHKMQGKEVN